MAMSKTMILAIVAIAMAIVFIFCLLSHSYFSQDSPQAKPKSPGYSDEIESSEKPKKCGACS